MRFKLGLSFLAAAILVLGCFLPWMFIESKGITITGIHTEPTSFGKPGYFHFVWAGLYLVFILVNKVWSKRAAVIVAAFNIAWALRNFLLIPVCAGGECPVRKEGLYLVLLGSFAMFITPMFTASNSGVARETD